MDGRRTTVSPPNNFRDHILKTIVGECKADRNLEPGREQMLEADERCTVCSRGENSQTSNEGMNNWVQCNR